MKIKKQKGGFAPAVMAAIEYAPIVLTVAGKAFLTFMDWLNTANRTIDSYRIVKKTKDNASGKAAEDLKRTEEIMAIMEAREKAAAAKKSASGNAK